MNQGDNLFSEDEIELRTVISILVRRWWLILLTALIAVAGVWLTNPEASVPMYESRVRLMLVPPVSEGLLNGTSGPSFASQMSADTLSSLATGNDLNLKIISVLDLKDNVSGDPWPVQRLSSMLNVSVQTDGGGPGRSILATIVRGADPLQVKRIADVWAEEFIVQNQDFFVSEAVRSYDFILAQFEQANLELSAVRRIRREYQEEFPLAMMREELSQIQDDRQEYQDALQNASTQLRLKRPQYEQAAHLLDELTVDGLWIGMDFNGRYTAELTALSPEQQTVIQAREALILARDDMERFEAESDSDFLEDNLEFQHELFASDQRQLRDVEGMYKSEVARLERMESEIESVPEFLVTIRAVESDALSQELGVDVTTDDLKRFQELGLGTERRNPTHSELAADIISSRASVDSYEFLTSYLQDRIEQSGAEITALQNEISEIKDVRLKLPGLEMQSQLAQSRYDIELESYDSLRILVRQIRNEIQSLEEGNAEYQGLVDRSEVEVQQMSNMLPAIELRNQELDQQIQHLQPNFNELEKRIRQAEIARLDSSDRILTLESAVESKSPLASTGRGVYRLVVGAALGAVVGMMMAYAWHYIPPMISASREPPMS